MRSTIARTQSKSMKLAYGPSSSWYWKRQIYRISGLHENCPRTRKFTHETFTRRQTRNDTSRCNSLEDVLRIPRNEMTVINDVSLSFYKLFSFSIAISYSINTERKTYIFPNYCSQAGDPQQPIPTHLIYE